MDKEVEDVDVVESIERVLLDGGLDKGGDFGVIRHYATKMGRVN